MYFPYGINRKVVLNSNSCSSYIVRKEDSLVFVTPVLTHIAADAQNAKSGLIPRHLIEFSMGLYTALIIIVPPISALNNINICHMWFVLPLILSPLKWNHEY